MFIAANEQWQKNMIPDGRKIEAASFKQPWIQGDDGCVLHSLGADV